MPKATWQMVAANCN